jgi:hypothetical protein
MRACSGLVPLAASLPRVYSYRTASSGVSRDAAKGRRERVGPSALCDLKAEVKDANGDERESCQGYEVFSAG